MKIETSGQKAVVIPEGRIDIKDSKELKGKAQELLNEGCCEMTVDFSQVTGIDSSGIGVLLLMQKKFQESGGVFKVIKVTSKNIQKIFKMMQIHKVINIEQEDVTSV